MDWRRTGRRAAGSHPDRLLLSAVLSCGGGVGSCADSGTGLAGGVGAAGGRDSRAASEPPGFERDAAARKGRVSALHP